MSPRRSGSSSNRNSALAFLLMRYLSTYLCKEVCSRREIRGSFDSPPLTSPGAASQIFDLRRQRFCPWQNLQTFGLQPRTHLSPLKRFLSELLQEAPVGRTSLFLPLCEAGGLSLLLFQRKSFQQLVHNVADNVELLLRKTFELRCQILHIIFLFLFKQQRIA